MLSFKISIIASHTSGTILLMTCFDILNRYCKLVNDSSVARNRSVTASLSCTDIGSLKFVQFFAILGPIKFIRKSKSIDDKLKKFWNCPFISCDLKSFNNEFPPETDRRVYS